MRMNRENPKSPTVRVKKHCANHNTGHTCSGAMISPDLRQWINADMCGKKCLVIDNKECDYFNKIVAPSIKET
jgi:hypothetical protein|tara:strand:+ start:329 stop:547 length:219 start_codon:yes stop_codon:yes gene_type:complete